MDSAALAAGDVRARLFDALAGVRKACRITPPVWSRLRLAILLHPLRVKFVKPPCDGRKARELGALDVQTLPDHGAELRAAVEVFAACGMAALPSKDTEAAVLVNAAAEVGRGGLYLAVDLGDETAMLAHTLPGRSLGEGLWLAAIGDAPPTLH